MRQIEPRCIYCGSEDTSSIEHMPPNIMWESGERPRGHEFVCCKNCNRGTSAADSVAGMMAYVRQDGTTTEKETEKIKKIMVSVNERVPGLGDRILSKAKMVMVRSPSGLLRPAYQIHIEDKVATEVLGVFAAKLGMGLYREHMGKALPLEGCVMTTWFANSGLTMDQANAILDNLPVQGELKQGKNNAQGKFDYRYGAHASGDLLMALASFRDSLHIFVIAVSNEELLNNITWMTNTTSKFKPGSLVERLKAVGVSGIKQDL